MDRLTLFLALVEPRNVLLGLALGLGKERWVSKVKITTWVDEETVGIIKGLAAQNEVSVSQLCALMLKRGVEEQAAGGVGVEVLLPAVRGAVRREVAGMADRLARLLARSALESAASRRISYQLLVGELGPEGAKAANEAAWMGSVQSLKRPARGLREILEGVSREEDRGDDAGGAETGSSGGGGS